MKAAHPLRAMTLAMTLEEERAVQRTAKATSERVDVVKRARALLAVQAGQSYTQAAGEAGYKSGDSISQLVERFNQRGLAALHIAGGRGRNAQYTTAQRDRILSELPRVPDRQADGAATWPTAPLPGRRRRYLADGAATWSLKTLERALRREALPREALPREALPRVSASTIQAVLHAAGDRFGKTRTWCPTGTAVRQRAGGPVTVQDPKAGEKSG